MAVLSYLFNMLAGLVLIFRIVVMLMFSSRENFFMKPIDPVFEIIYLFLSVFLIYALTKRSKLFSVIYFCLNLGYFGTGILKEIEGGGAPNFNIFIYIAFILIALYNFIDCIVNPRRTGKGRDTKTDWFYDGDQFTRKFDERSDRNQYRM